MSTLMPTDRNNNPIPALRLKDGGAHKIVSSATSARNTTAFANETQIVSLYATQGVHIKFGDATVTATASDHYFPAGVYYDFAIGGGGDSTAHKTHIAVLQDAVGGEVYISEKI